MNTKVHNLFSEINFEKTWEIIRDFYYSKEDGVKLEKAKLAYKAMLDEILDIPVTDEIKHLYVLGVMYYDTLGDNPAEEKIFDCSIYDAEKNEEYSMLLEPWEKVVCYLVSPYSIEKYGSEALAAHLLYEMSFFGFTLKTTNKQRENFENGLKKADEEAKKGHVFENLDDILLEAGLTKEEIEAINAEDSEENRAEKDRYEEINAETTKEAREATHKHYLTNAGKTEREEII